MGNKFFKVLILSGVLFIAFDRINAMQAEGAGERPPSLPPEVLGHIKEFMKNSLGLIKPRMLLVSCPSIDDLTNALNAGQRIVEKQGFQWRIIRHARQSGIQQLSFKGFEAGRKACHYEDPGNTAGITVNIEPTLLKSKEIIQSVTVDGYQAIGQISLPFGKTDKFYEALGPENLIITFHIVPTSQAASVNKEQEELYTQQATQLDRMSTKLEKEKGHFWKDNGE